MYADVARIKVRKASNCSLGDRLCSFAKIPMFVGPIQQTIITPRRVLGGGRAVSAVRLGTAMDQTFLHDFVNKSELTKELSSVRTSGGGDTARVLTATEPRPGGARRDLNTRLDSWAATRHHSGAWVQLHPPTMHPPRE